MPLQPHAPWNPLRCCRYLAIANAIQCVNGIGPVAYLVMCATDLVATFVKLWCLSREAGLEGLLNAWGITEVGRGKHLGLDSSAVILGERVGGTSNSASSALPSILIPTLSHQAVALCLGFPLLVLGAKILWVNRSAAGAVAATSGARAAAVAGRSCTGAEGEGCPAAVGKDGTHTPPPEAGRSCEGEGCSAAESSSPMTIVSKVVGPSPTFDGREAGGHSAMAGWGGSQAKTDETGGLPPEGRKVAESHACGTQSGAGSHPSAACSKAMAQGGAIPGASEGPWSASLPLSASAALAELARREREECGLPKAREGCESVAAARALVDQTIPEYKPLTRRIRVSIKVWICDAVFPVKRAAPIPSLLTPLPLYSSDPRL